MADQATISSNGKSASRMAAKGIAGLTHDVVTLAELQVKLAACDAKEMVRGLILPIVLAVIMVVTLLGAMITCFFAVAYALVEGAEWSQTAAFAASAGGGLVVVALLGCVAWYLVRDSIRTLERSRNELSENLKALKAMLKNHDQQYAR